MSPDDVVDLLHSGSIPCAGFSGAGARKVDTLPDALLDDVLAKVATLFE
jgi:site-specific DNA-cytosine methylase